MTTPEDDPPPNWPMIGMNAAGILGAVIVGMGNMSGCWYIMP
jgi:hypothetical protein